MPHLICVTAVIANLSNDNAGVGVGLLILSPVAFFIGGAVVAIAAVVALIPFMVWAVSSS